MTQVEENRLFELEDKGQNCSKLEYDEFQILFDKYYDQSFPIALAPVGVIKC